MSDMREVKAVVRKRCVQRLVKALKKAGVIRLQVCHVHALGAGVDPEDYQVSMEEGEAYTEKSKIEFVCAADRVDDFVQVIRDVGCTGHRGDGIVIVSEVEAVVNVRTGDQGTLALL